MKLLNAIKLISAAGLVAGQGTDPPPHMKGKSFAPPGPVSVLDPVPVPPNNGVGNETPTSIITHGAAVNNNGRKTTHRSLLRGSRIPNHHRGDLEEIKMKPNDHSNRLLGESGDSATELFNSGCAITTESACRATAISLGLQQGGGGYQFAGKYITKGCYAYSEGDYKGIAYWGSGGTVEEQQEDVVGEKYRPIPCGCAPTMESTCRVTAISLGLQQGGGGYPFAGDYTQKGCYAYSEGEYKGMAFWGQGGSDEQEQDQVKGGDGKYRPMPCSGCAPATESECKAAAKSQGLLLGGEGFDFAGEYVVKGCYAYNAGQFAGMAYWSRGGTDTEVQADPGDKMKYRPSSCFALALGATTSSPTRRPTSAPSPSPTSSPTRRPTSAPSPPPTSSPSRGPTLAPSAYPSASSSDTTVILPATTTGETVHGICIANGSFAEASSTQDTLTYSAIDPFTGTPYGWKDRDYTIYGQENTPCADGIFLQPSLHKAISPGTVITVTASAGSTICVFLEEVHDGRNGGWLSSLPSIGFTDYGVQSDFGWDHAKWTLFCNN